MILGSFGHFLLSLAFPVVFLEGSSQRPLIPQDEGVRARAGSVLSGRAPRPHLSDEGQLRRATGCHVLLYCYFLRWGVLLLLF